MKSNKTIAVIACLTATVLGGCVSLPDSPLVESVEVPEAWSGAGGKQGVSDAWLKDLNEPVLEGLVKEALARNHDLRAAAYRLEASKQAAIVAGADRLPLLNAGFSGTRARTVTQTTSATGQRVLFDATQDTYAPSLNLSWELDLWGRLKHVENAAVDEFLASEASYRAARLSLAAHVAKAWFDAVAISRQEDLADEMTENYARVAELIEERFANGSSQALDLRLARANAANARAIQALRSQQADGAVRALEVLLGRYPSRELEVAHRLPKTLPDIPAGVPSDLLERRPDLAQARFALNAAYERAQVARKLVLPVISLTGSAGTSSREMNHVLDGDYFIWSMAAGIVQPIFQGGRIEAGAQQAKVSWLEQWEHYRSTLLKAFREVETALAAESDLTRRADALELAASEAVQAESLAWERYQRGLVDMVTVLETQRRAFDARSSFIDAQNARLQNRLNLYLALGGDFLNLDEGASLIKNTP